MPIMSIAELEQLKAELKAELLAELTAKKREDSAWRKARDEIREEIKTKFGVWESHRVLEAGSTIARMVLNRKNTTAFTNADVRMTCDMLNEMLGVAVKYRDRQTIK